MRAGDAGANRAEFSLYAVWMAGAMIQNNSNIRRFILDNFLYLEKKKPRETFRHANKYFEQSEDSYIAPQKREISLNIRTLV